MNETMTRSCIWRQLSSAWKFQTLYNCLHPGPPTPHQKKKNKNPLKKTLQRSYLLINKMKWGMNDYSFASTIGSND